ncbi:hypothetical protein [Chitinophaga arvensicola]|uniref:Uncharacterized protein n=1 Tax=Chitinophaga arvensicola TaxID=29529 RepID=A0A1I0S8A4_9BACT|nr:hypothetical protein [Chitinophaga arvensicola]SEW52177.1 hypothetical protein SAMN04488122_4711 [Chitinophaga arvensicola]
MKYLSSALLATLLCFATHAANAQTAWKTFKHKNGFSLQLPGYFKEGLLVAAETLQWYTTDLDREISVTVEMWGHRTQADFQSDYNRNLKSEKDIVYSVIKPNWYVISGHEKDGIDYIFYQKSILKNDTQYHLRIRYPENEKARMDTILGKISASFR